MPKLTPDQLAKLGQTRENLPAKGPTEHAGFVSEIKHLLVDPDYDYAESTLRGIMETVEQTQVVTEGQRRAVRNITNAPSRRESRGEMRRRRWRE